MSRERTSFTFSKRCLTLGLTAEAIFPAIGSHSRAGNPTHHGWIDLAKMGYPYVKVGLLQQSVRCGDDGRSALADGTIGGIAGH